HLSAVPFEPSHITNGFSGLADGFPLAIYLFIGWENSAALAEETGNPRRNAPRAVFLSIALMIVGYILYAYATATGFNYNMTALGGAAIPFINVSHDIASWLALLAYIAGITSTLGVLISAVNSQSRLIFNAGREGLLPRWLGKVHPVRRTPVNAIYAFVVIAAVIIGVWALLHLIGGDRGSMRALNFFVESSPTGTMPGLVYYLVNPGQAAPYDWFPYAALGVIVVSVVYAIVVSRRDPGLGDRVGSIIADE